MHRHEPGIIATKDDCLFCEVVAATREQIADEIIKARNEATSPHHDFPHNECRLCAGMTFAAYIARGRS